MKFNPPVLKRAPASETFMAAVGCVHQDGFNQPQCGKPVLKQAPNGLLCGAHDRRVPTAVVQAGGAGSVRESDQCYALRSCARTWLTARSVKLCTSGVRFYARLGFINGVSGGESPWRIYEDRHCRECAAYQRRWRIVKYDPLAVFLLRRDHSDQ